MTRRHDPDRQQMDLFGELEPDDPVLAYYRRCRRAGLSLSYSIAENQIYVTAPGVIPRGATALALKYAVRLRADLLRVEHGVEPPREIRNLDGGAVLHRLPARRLPEQEPRPTARHYRAPRPR